MDVRCVCTSICERMYARTIILEFGYVSNAYVCTLVRMYICMFVHMYVLYVRCVANIGYVSNVTYVVRNVRRLHVTRPKRYVQYVRMYVSV
jgi:hypothetical protein